MHVMNHYTLQTAPTREFSSILNIKAKYANTVTFAEYETWHPHLHEMYLFMEWPPDQLTTHRPSKVAVVEIPRIHLRPPQKASQGQERHTKGLPSGCASVFTLPTESLKRDSCTCQQESHSPAKAAQHPRVSSVWRDHVRRQKMFHSTHRHSLLKCFKSQIT